MFPHLIFHLHFKLTLKSLSRKICFDCININKYFCLLDCSFLPITMSSKSLVKLLWFNKANDETKLHWTIYPVKRIKNNEYGKWNFYLPTTEDDDNVNMFAMRIAPSLILVCFSIQIRLGTTKSLDSVYSTSSSNRCWVWEGDF